MESRERGNNHMRPVNVVYNIFEFAAGSVLLEVGKTKILCAVTLQNGVPSFMRGQGSGWLTAEYSLLPAATHIRTPREISHMKKSGRAVEISRLIGRVLRSTVSLSRLGERTLYIDCDILQADGGTRTASITAASLALAYAEKKLMQERVINQPFINDMVVGVSVGYLDNALLVDPNYDEDSKAVADFNFALSKSGQLLEIQGGAEKQPLSWDVFLQACNLAREEAKLLFNQLEAVCSSVSITSAGKKLPLDKAASFSTTTTSRKAPLFSLMNRLSP